MLTSKISLRWIFWIAAALVIAFVPVPVRSAAPADRTIRVEANSFEYTPGVLQVNPHDRVTIELVSTDVVHGIYIDGYNLEVIADPGQTRSLSFVADRTGVFRFRCSVTCGALHPFMIGKLQVGKNLQLWRAAGLALLAALAGVWSFRR
jgi:heme/copper-type cytochrome/quinol oxidase subunit 2